MGHGEPPQNLLMMNRTWVSMSCLVYDKWNISELCKIWFVMNGTWVNLACLVYDKWNMGKLGKVWFMMSGR